MPTFVKAHMQGGHQVRAHTRGTRSKLAHSAKRWKQSKLKTLKQNAYARYKTSMYTRGVSRQAREHHFNRYRKIEKAFHRSVGL